MALHLIKLCVGAQTPDDLRTWRAARSAAGYAPVVRTRQTPKRAAEILAGGSLYWVFKGVILVRQPVRAIETIGEGAARRCEIRIGDEMIATVPQPRRAFQGWRYLEQDDVPADLGASTDGEVPADLARRLREIGAW